MHPRVSRPLSTLGGRTLLLQFWVRFPLNLQSETSMQKTSKWLAAATLLAMAAGAHAQVNQIRVWAAACANCHGTEGRAEPGMIGLAGRNKDELLQQLLAFKNGQRPATIMHQLSKGYSDEQLAQIAAYFAAQKK